MPFIGIITNAKNEEYIKKKLSQKFPVDHIIFINDKNIENVKNIRFETISIDIKINKTKILKQILENAKFLILNSDLDINLDILEDLSLVILSYGFNNKATFTVSSVNKNNIIICLQRIIKNIFNQKYDSQEFETEVEENVEIYAIISVLIILLIYQKI